MSAKKIDDDAYAEGQKMFRKGVTIRQMVQSVIDLENEDAAPGAWEKSREKRANEENKLMSRAIGFADALLDTLRKR